MTKRNKLFFYVVGLLVVVEALSYLSYFTPTVGWVALAVISLATLYLSFKNITWGLLIVIAEWVIGSQGYIFSASIESTTISLRMALWIIVMAVWVAKELISLIQKKESLKKYQSLPYARQLSFLGLVLVLGIAVALLNNNDLSILFIEGKRWIYILILLPLLTSFTKKEEFKTLSIVVAAAITVLCLKAFILIYIFSHVFIPLVYDVYGWMRLNLLGEITRLPSGFSRVFMQSQIFLLPVAFGAFGYLLRRLYKENKVAEWGKVSYSILTAICFSVIIASLSRSFWIGLAIGTVVAIILYIKIYKPGVKRFFQTVGIGLGVSIISALLLFVIIKFPYPTSTAQLDPSLLTNRANPMEAGAASRWSLLPVMWETISDSPLWGYGFGKTITYFTSDPRITSTTVDGEYTTYAFEWGWLDIWLKLGLLGVAAYLWLLMTIIRDGYQVFKQKALLGNTIIFGVVAISVVHFFTPYLNHPLGFGYLGLIMLLTKKYLPAED